MKVSEKFLKAKADKRLSAFLVAKIGENAPIIRLCVDVKDPYDDYKTDHSFIECETELRIDSYWHGNRGEKLIITRINFFESVWHHFPSNHLLSFLSLIKKDTDVKFRAVIFNGSDYYREHNLAHHSLYGILDDKKVFLLSYYVGADNFVSPVSYSIGMQERFLTDTNS